MRTTLFKSLFARCKTAVTSSHDLIVAESYDRRKVFIRRNAENVLSAVADVTGIVRVIRSKRDTSQSNVLLLLMYFTQCSQIGNFFDGGSWMFLIVCSDQVREQLELHFESFHINLL